MMGEWFLVAWVALTVLVAVVVKTYSLHWWSLRGETDG